MLSRRAASIARFVVHVGPPCLAAGLVAFAPNAAPLAQPEPRYAVIDLHVDLPYQAIFRKRDLAHGSGQYPASALLAAGVSGVVLPLFIPKDAPPSGPTVKHLEATYATLQARLPGIPPYTTAPCSGQPGRVDAFHSFEGVAPLADDLDSVFRWAKRGLRFFGLTHTTDDAIATSSGTSFQAPVRLRGLSEVGKELVRRVHAAGAIVDVSHASDATVSDVLLQATADDAVVVATHSNARAIAPHARNLTDAQLRAIGERGGVVGVNFHSPYLLGGAGRATIDDVVRHVRHIARVAGIHAVAIGSDFEGGIRPPRGLTDVRGFPALAMALREAGFSSAEVELVLSRNARRVLCRNPAP